MIRERLTYANVMATLALFVALGGVGYAAVRLPRDSVGPKQIKEDAVKASELAPNSVDSFNVIDGAIAGNDILPNTIGGNQIAGGAIGSAEIADGGVGAADLAAQQEPQTPELGECAPGVNWQPAALSPPSYWMDARQMVHMDGGVSCAASITSDGSIFEMPFNFRPHPSVVRFAQLGNNLSFAQIAVVGNPTTAGLVYDGGSDPSTEQYIALDGITYRGEGPIP
jgi:hypothetical protein